jgi:hypothetical protein
MPTPERGGRPEGSRVETIAVTLAVMVAAAVAAGLFLPHQALWIDETTQLSGLSLRPAGLLHWLVHPASHDFGVPGDRMPPLSYWLEWVWSRFFGLNETSLRWFGAVCAAGAAGLVSSAARRAFGRRAGLFAGLFLALSPNACVTAVEIRAYPLFLLTTAGALRTLVVILRAPPPGARRGIWIQLTVWLIAGMYVHFFGALFGGLVVLGLAVDALTRRRALRPIVVVATILALGLAGLVPFVIASQGLSAVTVRDRRHEVIQLVYRLIGHPAMAVFPLATVLAFGSAATLLVLAACRLPEGSRGPFRFFALVLAAGIAISAAANFVVGGFTAAKVSYATWAVPVICLALAAPLTRSAGRWSGIALGAAVVLLACQGVGIAELARNGDYFAHGPQPRLQRILDGLGQRHPAVIHADPIADYGAAYFPLRFANGPGLAQFVFAEPGTHPPLGIPLDPTSDRWKDQLRDYGSLVVVRSEVQSAHQLAEQIHGGDRGFGESRLISALESSPQWRRQGHWLFVSFVAADVTVFERTAPGGP